MDTRISIGRGAQKRSISKSHTCKESQVALVYRAAMSIRIAIIVALVTSLPGVVNGKPSTGNHHWLRDLGGRQLIFNQL
jgi:hypothetical protein